MVGREFKRGKQSAAAPTSPLLAGSNFAFDLYGNGALPGPILLSSHSLQLHKSSSCGFRNEAPAKSSAVNHMQGENNYSDLQPGAAVAMDGKLIIRASCLLSWYIYISAGLLIKVEFRHGKDKLKTWSGVSKKPIIIAGGTSSSQKGRMMAWQRAHAIAPSTIAS